MKTLTTAIALIATSFVVSAAPAVAADNAAYEQRAKLERLFAQARARNSPDVMMVKGDKMMKGDKMVSARSKVVLSVSMPTGPEAAERRLRAVQPIPAGR